MIRCVDVILSLVGLVASSPLILIVLVILIFDTGSPLFFQRRMGRNQIPFTLVKFRTMRVGTDCVGTHLVDSGSVTRIGGLLRVTKLDELPQLWNVLKGEMSLVGPRPNLFNQELLIQKREALGAYEVRPGITGLAQIKRIDMSTPEVLAETDAEMISSMSLFNYFKYIFLTFTGRGQGDRICR